MRDVRVDAKGEIDTSTADALRDEIYSAIDSNPGACVTVDLSAVEFMDSTGLAVLVASLKHARDAGGSVAIAISGAPASIKKLFTITGLDRVFGLSL